MFPGYAELRLGPLGLEDVHAIVQQRVGLSLPRPTLRSVHETAAGNPYFSLELSRATAEGGASLSSTLRELVGARIAALPAETRRALAAAAALADPTLDLVGAAIGDDAGGALAVAFEEEIVGVSDGRIRFAHPLLAAAAYASAGTHVRDLHTVLAGLVIEPRNGHGTWRSERAGRTPTSRRLSTRRPGSPRLAARRSRPRSCSRRRGP